MRLFRVVLGAALVLSVVLAPPVSAQSASPSDVSVTLSPAKQSFGRSSDVTVRVTIANAGAVDSRVLSWLTPANGVQAPIFDVSRDGEPTAYLGMLAKRAAPTVSDYIPLPARTSLEYDVDLSDVYSFTKTGDYEVSYSVTAAQLLGTGAKSTRTLISSPVTVAVAGRPDAAPRVTPESGAGLTYSACSVQQQSDLSTAFTGATSYAGAGVQYFTEERRGPRYQLWFGAFDNARWERVESHYSLIRAATQSAPVAFECDGTSSAYAYVYPNDPYKIYLGDAFWPAPMTGTDSKAGTLIHELSHFTVLGGTQDYVYGQTGAKNLAISNPAQAVMNADSHEYFVENTPVTADGSAYTLSTTSLDFGEQTAGSTSAPRSVTLISRGDANLVIGSLNASGEFGLASDTCTGATVPPAGTCTFTVAFQPTAPGDRASSITIPSDAARTTNTVSLKGTGTAVPPPPPPPPPTAPAAEPAEPAASPTPTPAPRKSTVATLRAKAGRSTLLVKVEPSLGPTQTWQFRIQTKSGKKWKTVGKVYRTSGKANTRVIDLRQGVYRVQVTAANGYETSFSNSIRLKR